MRFLALVVLAAAWTVPALAADGHSSRSCWRSAARVTRPPPSPRPGPRWRPPASRWWGATTPTRGPRCWPSPARSRRPRRRSGRPATTAPRCGSRSPGSATRWRWRTPARSTWRTPTGWTPISPRWPPGWPPRSGSWRSTARRRQDRQGAGEVPLHVRHGVRRRPRRHRHLRQPGAGAPLGGAGAGRRPRRHPAGLPGRPPGRRHGLRRGALRRLQRRRLHHEGRSTSSRSAPPATCPTRWWWPAARCAPCTPGSASP